MSDWGRESLYVAMFTEHCSANTMLIFHMAVQNLVWADEECTRIRNNIYRTSVPFMIMIVFRVTAIFIALKTETKTSKWSLMNRKIRKPCRPAAIFHTIGKFASKGNIEHIDTYRTSKTHIPIPAVPSLLLTPTPAHYSPPPAILLPCSCHRGKFLAAHTKRSRTQNRWRHR